MTAHRINPADLLKAFSIPQLENIASEQMKKWGDRFSIPVDIEKILEKTPNVDFDIYPRLRDRYHLEGMAGTNDEGLFVVYIDDFLADKDAYIRRYRMTVAEEFAHIILHPEAIKKVRTPMDFLDLHKSQNWGQCERNAKKLAAMLLMPWKYVLQDGGELYSEYILSFPSGQRYTSSVGIAIKNHIKGKLADKYIVSPLAMGYRLDEWKINIYEKVDEAIKNHFDFLE